MCSGVVDTQVPFRSAYVCGLAYTLQFMNTPDLANSIGGSCGDGIRIQLGPNLMTGVAA